MKKIFTLILLALLPVVANAYDAQIDGIYYNFSGDEATVVSGTQYSGAVVIPESVTYNSQTYTVTNIGENAFYGCSGLTSVTIPEGVTSIGSCAFMDCSGLTSVTIPESVTSIGYYAFMDCSGLTSINIPAGVTSFGYSAFSGCTGLTAVHITDLSAWCKFDFGYGGNPLIYAHHLYLNGEEVTDLTIPEDVTRLNSYAFYGCEGLTSVTIPEGVTSIGGGAFSGCSGLTSVTIPNSVTSIGYNAFSGCSGLTSVTLNNDAIVSSGNLGELFGYQVQEYVIGDAVKSIGRRAFSGCSSLISVTIGDGVTSIGDYAFQYCDSLISVTIGNGVTSIGDYAFYDCYSLISVNIPEGVTSIGERAFYNCNSLTSITIPESVTSIGSSAFYDCSSLTSINIPAGVTSIGDYAFYGCTGLTAVHITDLSAWYKFEFGYGENPLIYAHHLYLNGEEVTDLIIPEDMTRLNGYVFYGCEGLTSVTIPAGLTSIGDYAFSGCTGLTAVHITDLSAWCKITFVNDGSNPLSSAHHLYLNGEEITDLTIPEDVTSLNGYVFCGCAGLTSITIPNGLTTIGQGAFQNCSGLTSVTIPESLTEVEGSAFRGCKLRSVLVKCITPPTVSSSSFSEQTYYHTTLYIPTGSWDAYAYDDAWYNFINIRETATAEEQLSMQQAYTLMDASTFAYSVYDPVNNCIGTIASVSGIDENNPNHSWQVIESDGSHYLYNVGAKKFVVASSNGSFALTDTPTSIEMENGDNGIIIGAQTAKQWALVSNDRMSAEQAIIDGIENLTPALSEREGDWYDLAGRKVQTPQRGIYIKNGKKVMVK